MKQVLFFQLLPARPEVSAHFASGFGNCRSVKYLLLPATEHHIPNHKQVKLLSG
jgi:hypothetical protein